MNDRGVWKLCRKGGWFIPFHIKSQCYHSGAEEKESCRDVSSEPVWVLSERGPIKMCTGERVRCICVCACAKAWKAASQTVISKTMCQLTEGTHAPLYSGLSSGPALCLFFLQWTGSSVYNSHPKPSLRNILPAAAARHADAAPTSPNPLPVFAWFAEHPPTFFKWSRFFFLGDKKEL